MQSALAESAEDAVRKYLVFLDDPASLVDADRVESLEKDLASESDPVERLKILSALERASSADGAALRSNFVKHAAGFARSENIPPTAFLSMGVPRQTLLDAGLLPGGRSPGQVPGRSRNRRVGQREVVSVARGLTEGFTARDLMEACGANRMTVSKALDALVTEGALVELPATGDRTAGRSPRRYRFV